MLLHTKAIYKRPPGNQFLLTDTDYGATPGNITLKLRPDAAPKTVAHISKLVGDGLYNGCCFYRSDFVIQCGLHGRANKQPPFGNLPVNETKSGAFVSNTG